MKREIGSITFWEEFPQVPLIQATSALLGVTPLVIATGLASKKAFSDRPNLVMSRPHGAVPPIIRSPSREQIHDIVEERSATKDVHVVHGFGTSVPLQQAHQQLAGTEATIFVSSEAGRTFPPHLSALRRARHLAQSLRYSRRIAGFLAIGKGAEDYFAPLKMLTTTLPYGYFIEPNGKGPDVNSTGWHHRLVFAGQLTKRKGLDILLRAMANLKSQNVTLQVAGDGPERRRLEGLSELLGLSSKVTWLGKVRNENVKDLLAASTIAVLPSRFDGWGVIVNEALVAGIPVVVSDAVGARSVVISDDVGLTFRSGSAQSLASALDALLVRENESVVSRRERSEWAKQRLTASAGASYLVDILQADVSELQYQERFIPPWQRPPLG